MEFSLEVTFDNIFPFDNVFPNLHEIICWVAFFLGYGNKSSSDVSRTECNSRKLSQAWSQRIWEAPSTNMGGPFPAPHCPQVLTRLPCPSSGYLYQWLRIHPSYSGLYIQHLKRDSEHSFVWVCENPSIQEKDILIFYSMRIKINLQNFTCSYRSNSTQNFWIAIHYLDNRKITCEIY